MTGLYDRKPGDLSVEPAEEPLLPDHLHFLAEGRDEQSDLTEFVKLFKQRSAYYQRLSTPYQLWQNRFYDHILRHADSMLEVACYIWMNPVRSGLCAGPREYPLSGSQTIDWMKMKEIASSWTPPWKDTEAGLKSGTYRTNLRYVENARGFS